ncbi:MAG: PHP domain-containing protein [Butyrivibrio sp.]|nr:PHP domain-containing protein [Butyrivibrio sp.]
MKRIDLHTHSTCSDGSYSVHELIDYAHEKGLAAIALTDHDTIDGVEEAVNYGKEKYPDMEVIPGIEFSTVNEGKDVHVVGLYVDYNDQKLKDRLATFKNARVERNIKMCKKLTEGGIKISYEDLTAAFPDTSITRAHYAKYMLEKGYIKSKQEAFDRYIGDSCPYFVPRENITPEMAIECILDNGAVPILAHPVLYHMSDAKLEALVVRLKEVGLKGLEAIYTTYEAYEERQMKELAAKHGLLVSGGSDFHGSNKVGIDLGVGYGSLFVPEDLLPQIKASVAR